MNRERETRGQLFEKRQPQDAQNARVKYSGARFLRRFVSHLLLWVMVFSGVSSVYAQGGPLLHANYYRTLRSMYEGQYEDAGKRFDVFARNAYRDQHGRFLDSICYWSMTAENHYRLGQYPDAIGLYESALSLYADVQNWPTRAQFPPAIQTDQAGQRRAQVPWAQSSRRFTIGNFNSSILILLGNSPEENDRVLREGGVIDLERYQSVDMAEVMRCVALAAHRRHVIKGDICTHDPFTREISARLSTPVDTTNMAGAWQGVVKGVVLASQGEWDAAARLLQQSLQVGGNYDHPLTPIALLKLGYIAEHQRQWGDALGMYLEASISAAAFEQFDVIEEALTRAANLHLLGRTGQPLPALTDAIQWAKVENLDPLRASLLTQAAMIAAEGGAADQALDLLEQARRQMSRNDLRRSILILQTSYVRAMTQFLKLKTDAGLKELDKFYKAADQFSRWRYQVRLADELVLANAATDRESEKLYGSVLREPTDDDWLLEPVETMAFQTFSHFQAIERWFEIALNRKADERALSLSEYIRRQRFFSTLPLGGRIMGLRWTLEADGGAIPAADFGYREWIFNRFKDYRQTSDQLVQQRQQLLELPLQPDDKSPEQLEQEKLLDQLFDTVRHQEDLLYKIALQREPCPLSFPPRLDNATIQSQLQPGQLIISLLRIGPKYYVMSLSNQSYAVEGIIPAKSFDQNIRALLKELRVSTETSISPLDKFKDDDWKKPAKKLAEQLFPKANEKFWRSVNEIIFVPDSVAWYLPIETLQFPDPNGEETVSLYSKVKVRYAPTMSLAIPDQRVLPRFPRFGIVAQSNFLRDSQEVVREELARLQDENPGVVEIKMPLAGPGHLLSSVMDQLVVWHTTEVPKRESPYALNPLGYASKRPGDDLASWIGFPWHGPQQIVLSGFSSAIEGKGRAKANGDDLFLLTCGLMGSGTRTVLLSRWRVGGQVTLDLTREFSLQMGKIPAVDAWRRATDLLRDSELDLQREPRVRETSADEPFQADHPYFWAGFLLADTGADPTQQDEPENDELVDPEPADAN